jgi:hypothetical protein
MCYYITAVLPPGTNQTEAQAIAERHGRTLAPIANPGIEEQLRSGELYFLTTAGHCDCDTSIGVIGRKTRSDQSRRNAKAKKLAGLGWSKAKTERALSQSDQSHERSAIREQKSAEADIEAWVAFMTDLHRTGIRYVGLLLHFYDGALSQDIRLKDRVLVRSDVQARELLPLVAEDTLYEFRSMA